ncbi:peptidylprolyl isomerase [Bacteroidota bacterium]
MAQAKEGDLVKVHYTGKLDNGEVFDTSESREPLAFTIGKGEVIPGFENGVIGLGSGESKTIKIPSDQAYGPHREEMIYKIGKDKFPQDVELKIGDSFKIGKEEETTLIVSITEIGETEVTLDANHPLAGKELTFEIKLVEIN